MNDCHCLSAPPLIVILSAHSFVVQVLMSISKATLNNLTIDSSSRSLGLRPKSSAAANSAFTARVLTTGPRFLIY